MARPVQGPEGLPLFAWRATPRRIAPRGRRCARLALLVMGTAALAAPLFLKPKPRWLWNASASAPLGLYRLSPGRAPARGDWVVAWPPPAARALAAKRRYLPANVPLVKRAAAVAGDRICAAGAAILVAGRVAAMRRRADAAGRVLPWSWRRCRTLAPGQYLLLNSAPGSFDGRYFGVTRRAELVGRATLIWAR